MADLFREQEIPFTQTRLASLIKIKGSYKGYIPDGNRIPTDMGDQRFIGAVTKVKVDVNRGATERRELNFDTYGNIIEMVPGLVSFDVSFDRVWLYESSMLEACGFGGHTLEFQTRPMLFQLLLPRPANSSVPDKTIVLVDCWLKDNPATWSVDNKDDLRIVQTVNIACGGIFEV